MNSYFDYLIYIGHLEIYSEYLELFKHLHCIDFTYVLDRDENREADGLDLRYDFYDIIDKSSEHGSVLEVLIALSIRVDSEYIGDPGEEHPELFFMEMLENLGLTKYKRGRFNKDEVIKIVDRWLNREFCEDGRGSPFPVKYDDRDQRGVEIWDQMISYIDENYN